MNEKIYSSIPVNKLAKINTSKHLSDGYIPKNNRWNVYMSKNKPPLINYKGKPDSNLTGKKFGKLKVVGVFTHQRKGRSYSLKWVVLCLCGYYTVRLGTTIKRKIKYSHYDECDYCQQASKRKFHEVI